MIIIYENNIFPMYEINIADNKFESEYGEIQTKSGKTIEDVRNAVIQSLEQRLGYVELSDLCVINMNKIQSLVIGEKNDCN